VSKITKKAALANYFCKVDNYYFLSKSLFMKKILVPVDFSGASDWGFNYAYRLAEQFEAELHVVHIYRPPYVESTMPAAMIQQIINDKERDLLQHLMSNAQAPLNFALEHHLSKVKIHYLLESGANADIADIARKINADIIVMGTHGAGNAIQKVWGTNTAKVIRDAKCPVMAVPLGAEFKSVMNIAYATDYDSNDLDNIMQLLLFAKAINAKVHCVHIKNILDSPDDTKEADFKAKFEERFADLQLSFSVHSSTSVEEGLETFLRVNHMHILSMLTHKRTVWDRMFGEKSMTREMVMRSMVPILAFHS
jgi:nucleotide-binding universal stress UspA family protein